MKFDWDDAKARRNFIKHRVAFDVAIKAFDDPQSLSVPDRMVGGEERWRTVGRVGLTTMFFVAHTWLEEGGEIYVRVITARKATRHEIKGYETGDERYLR